jgi:hypothetical protein
MHVPLGIRQLYTVRFQNLLVVIEPGLQSVVQLSGRIRQGFVPLPIGLPQHDLRFAEQGGEGVALDHTTGEPPAGHADDAEVGSLAEDIQPLRLHNDPCQLSLIEETWHISPAHYLVLEIKERTKMTVKIATTSTRGKGKKRGRRNGSPRSECMAQPPTIATPMIIHRVVIRGNLLVGF